MLDPLDPNSPPSDLARPQWQLRVLNGPGRGSTCEVTGRVAIGRASTSDLQIVEQEVSRQHARIVVDEEGRHVLEDLKSSNGTFADGEPVTRRVLAPHTVITIVNTQIVYEPAAAAAAPAPGRHADIRTLRNTAEHHCLVARSHAPTTPTGAAVPSWAITDRTGRALVFERPDGGEYEGNLVEDIVEYRMLRAQHLRGGFADADMGRRFEVLRDRLVAPLAKGKPEQRAFRRFGCWLPAEVRLASGNEHPCQVRDIGVDGAQLVAVSHGLVVEAIVWLSIELVEGGQPRSLVLAARVAWVDDEFVGLAFAGAPRRVDGRYAEHPGPSHRESLDDRNTAPHPAARSGLRLASGPEGG
jgi:FHA domain/PilZ domain